jgi:hypothetical protein
MTTGKKGFITVVNPFAWHLLCKTYFKMKKESVFHFAIPAIHDGSALTDNHQPLLHKIGANFGFGEKETDEMVEQVFRGNSVDLTNGKHSGTLKIRLAKNMVQKCIFTISCTMFSQYPTAVNLLPAINRYINTSPVPEIPLSYQTVFVLLRSIGFGETEVAEILNISGAEVRKRFAKAQKLINAE